MAIMLGDFVGQIKREGQFGSLLVTNDQPTLDILNATNRRLARIWAAANWRWRHEKLSIALVPNQSEYKVVAASGNPIDRIMNLYPLDNTTNPPLRGKPLIEKTERQFFSECDTRPGYCPGVPEKYWNEGMDANNIWNIQVSPTPMSPGTIVGSAKMVLVPYVLADILANNPFTYFPNDVILDTLFDGVMSSVAACKGDTAGRDRLDGSFEAKLKILMGEQLGVANDDTPITSEPPTMVKRGGYPGYRDNGLRR